MIILYQFVFDYSDKKNGKWTYFKHPTHTLHSQLLYWQVLSWNLYTKSYSEMVASKLYIFIDKITFNFFMHCCIRCDDSLSQLSFLTPPQSICHVPVFFLSTFHWHHCLLSLRWWYNYFVSLRQPFIPCLVFFVDFKCKPTTFC